MSLNFNSLVFTPTSHIDGSNLKANFDRNSHDSGSTSITATPTSTTFSSPANTSPSVSPQYGKENGDPLFHGIPNFGFLNEPNNTWSSPKSVNSEQELSRNLYGYSQFSTNSNLYEQPLDMLKDKKKYFGMDNSPTYNSNFDFSQNLTNRANQLLVFPDIKQSKLEAKKINSIDIVPKFSATNDSLLSSKSVVPSSEASNAFDMSIFNGIDSTYASCGNFPQRQYDYNFNAYAHVNNGYPLLNSNSHSMDSMYKQQQNLFQSNGDLDARAPIYTDSDNIHSISKQGIVQAHRPRNNGLVYTVQFKRAHRTFLLDSSLNTPVNAGDFVKVEADRGEDLGIVCEISDISSVKSSALLNKLKNGVSTMKCITRLATPGESAQLKGKMSEEDNVIQCCRDRAISYMLPMQVVDAEYQFDRHKLTIYYESNKRIDFRELVRDLFSVYKTRIWMEHITYSFRPHSGGATALATGHALHFFNQDLQGVGRITSSSSVQIAHSRPFGITNEDLGRYGNNF
jgi:hypothetical protein